MAASGRCDASDPRWKLRARELALINGRDSSKPTEADYQQAKRELTGEDNMDPQQEIIESLSEWDLRF